jgi:flagellar motor switch protein FliG
MANNPNFEAVPSKGSGIRKACILVLALGDQLAREVFTRLNEKEIRQLGRAAANLEDVTPRELLEVLTEFKHIFQGGWIPSAGAGSAFQLMAERVLGEERARDLLTTTRQTDPFEECNTVPPKQLAALLGREHPQTAAIVLRSIDAEHASKTLNEMPAEQASELVYRIAHLTEPSEEIRRDIGDSLAEELRYLPGRGADGEEEFDPQQHAIDLLKGLSRENTDQIFEHLQSRSSDFAGDLRSKLFIFDDLVALDSRSMQQLLREVDSRKLAVAMKGAPEDLQNLIYASMSSRAADMLRDDLEAMGPTPLSEVEGAQEAIVAVALRMEEEGVLSIPRGGDSEFV